MELNNCINYLLSVSQNKVFQYFSQQLSTYHLTPAQYGVLNCLWYHGPLSPKQIGELLMLGASSISGILDRMQKGGLIERNIDPSNRRAILVSETSKAHAMKEGILNIVSEMNQKFLAPLSEAERTVFINSLRTIISTNT